MDQAECPQVKILFMYFILIIKLSIKCFILEKSSLGIQTAFRAATHRCTIPSRKPNGSLFEELATFHLLG